MITRAAKPRMDGVAGRGTGQGGVDMNILKRFGSGSRLYTFPVGSQITYEDDFDTLAKKMIRLAGANGGYSNMGMGRGQSLIGTVRADLWLTFNDYAEATDKMTSLRQMADWGVQPLYRRQFSGVRTILLRAVNSASQIRQNVINVPHERHENSGDIRSVRSILAHDR